MAQIYQDAQGRSVYEMNGQVHDAKTGQVIEAAPLSGTGTPAPNTPELSSTQPPQPTLPDTGTSQSPLLSFASSLDAAVNAARKSRNKSSLDMMAPFQGTVAASDFNSILGNLNAASDKTSEDLIKRATEKVGLKSDTVTVGGDLYQVQKDSDGNIVGKPVLVLKAPKTPKENVVTDSELKRFINQQMATPEFQALSPEEQTRYIRAQGGSPDDFGF